MAQNTQHMETKVNETQPHNDSEDESEDEEVIDPDNDHFGYKGDQEYKQGRPIMSGKGKLQYKKYGKVQSTYTGQFQDDKRHGQGVMVFEDKSEYTGDWENDMR
jgi:hypothetical protein